MVRAQLADYLNLLVIPLARRPSSTSLQLCRANSTFVTRSACASSYRTYGGFLHFPLRSITPAIKCCDAHYEDERYQAAPKK